MKFEMSKKWCQEMAKLEDEAGCVPSAGGQMHRTNPVHEENGKWYFWIESWHDRFGPYDTKEECEKQFDHYCKNVLGT